MTSDTRIVLADDHIDVRAALRLFLEQEGDIVVVGEAISAESMVTQALSLQPDIVMLDWELAGAARALERLRAFAPSIRVVALSSYPESRLPALGAGVEAFVSKGEAVERILDALHSLSTCHAPHVEA